MRVVVLRDLMDRFFFCARGKMYLLKYSKRLLVNHSNKHRISSNRILHNFSLAITCRSPLALSKFSLKLSLRGYIYRVFYNNQSQGVIIKYNFLEFKRFLIEILLFHSKQNRIKMLIIIKRFSDGLILTGEARNHVRFHGSVISVDQPRWDNRLSNLRGN